MKEIKAGGSSREVAVVIKEWVDICKLRQENDDEGVQALVAALLGKKKTNSNYFTVLQCQLQTPDSHEHLYLSLLSGGSNGLALH